MCRKAHNLQQSTSSSFNRIFDNRATLVKPIEKPQSSSKMDKVKKDDEQSTLYENYSIP